MRRWLLAAAGAGGAAALAVAAHAPLGARAARAGPRRGGGRAVRSAAAGAARRGPASGAFSFVDALREAMPPCLCSLPSAPRAAGLALHPVLGAGGSAGHAARRRRPPLQLPPTAPNRRNRRPGVAGGLGVHPAHAAALRPGHRAPPQHLNRRPNRRHAHAGGCQPPLGLDAHRQHRHAAGPHRGRRHAQGLRRPLHRPPAFPPPLRLLPPASPPVPRGRAARYSLRPTGPPARHCPFRARRRSPRRVDCAAHAASAPERLAAGEGAAALARCQRLTPARPPGSAAAAALGRARGGAGGSGGGHGGRRRAGGGAAAPRDDGRRRCPGGRGRAGVEAAGRAGGCRGGRARDGAGHAALFAPRPPGARLHCPQKTSPLRARPHCAGLLVRHLPKHEALVSL